MVAIAAARRTPQRVGALLAVITQECEPALGNWQAELAEWQGLLISVHGAARAMARAMPGLQVDAKRMLVNLEAVRGETPEELADEGFAPALVEPASVQAISQVAFLQGCLAAIDAAAIAMPASAF